MELKSFDLYEHHQLVMKKLMSKSFRDHVASEGKAEMTETSGPFTVKISVVANQIK